MWFLNTAVEVLYGMGLHTCVIYSPITDLCNAYRPTISRCSLLNCVRGGSIRLRPIAQWLNCSLELKTRRSRSVLGWVTARGRPYASWTWVRCSVSYMYSKLWSIVCPPQTERMLSEKHCVLESVHQLMMNFRRLLLLLLFLHAIVWVCLVHVWCRGEIQNMVIINMLFYVSKGLQLCICL